MPTIAGKDSTLQKLVSEIYDQKWPRHDYMASDKARSPSSRTVKFTALQYWKENERPGRANKGRPFSASFIATRQDNFSRMSASRTSPLEDVALLNTATFKRKKKQPPKVPEYDSRKVLSDSSSARNRALAAEYIAMLSGKNYLKRHYREQYWMNEAASRNRPHTAGGPTGQRRYATLYPDLGSVLGSGASNATTVRVARPAISPRSATQWRLPAARSQSRNSSIPNCNPLDNFSEGKSVVVAELGVSFETKHSLSNTPTEKCQRIPSYPNETLASLCLEGTTAPSRTSNSRTSSLSSTISIHRMPEGRYSSAGESTPSGSCSSDATGGSRAGSGDDEPLKNYISLISDNTCNTEAKSPTNSEHERMDIPKIIDSVVEDDDDQSTQDDDVTMDEVTNHDGPEEFTSDALEKSVGRISFSDLEESDISENEADDYEEDAVDENEANRRLMQVNAVFDATRIAGFHAASVEDPAGDRESKEDYHTAEQPLEPIQYSAILPGPYNEFDLKSLANLPPGMDWRAFVPCSETENTAAPSRLNNSERWRLRRRNERETSKQKNVEEFVDRLVMLEKLQIISVQYERDRRKHVVHRSKARNAAKAANSSQPTSSNAVVNTTSSTSPKDSEDVRPQSARSFRRRPSNVSATLQANSKSHRKSNVDARTELFFGNKSSPDLDLVRLSCTKNHLQYFRRNSTSPRKKQRPGLFLPRHYEYSWSERLPPSKRPSLNSLFYNKPRNCQYCRESEKKAHLHSLQMLMNRPRSGYVNFPSNKQGSYRSRPTSSSAIIHTTPRQVNISNCLPEPNKAHIRNASCSQQTTSVSRDTNGFKRTSSSSGVQAKISIARLSLVSVAKDYAKAASKPTKFTRHPSAPSCRSWTSGRSSPALGMNRKR